MCMVGDKHQMIKSAVRAFTQRHGEIYTSLALYGRKDKDGTHKLDDSKYSRIGFTKEPNTHIPKIFVFVRHPFATVM